MVWIQVFAPDQATLGVVIVAHFEMCQRQIVVSLCIILVKCNALLKSADRLLKITHFVEGDSEVEVALWAVLAIHIVQMIASEVFQIKPDFIGVRVCGPLVDQLQRLLLEFGLNQLSLPRLFLLDLLRKLIFDPLSRSPLFRQQSTFLIHLQI